MEALPSPVQAFFVWLLQTTLVASILIGLILAVQKLLGGRLGPRWCHALWLILLIRMALPWAPPSPISLFNLIPATIAPVQRQDYRGRPVQKDSPLPAASVGASQSGTAPTSNPPEATQVPVVSEVKKLAVASSPVSAILLTLRQTLPALWLAGALVLSGYLLASSFSLWRIVKRDHPVTNQPILELFEECKSQMGVQTLVALVPNEQIRSAALLGFLRPRLLLPQRMIETASRNELRYVFLHELAHLKRGDIYLGWLTSLLQVLHWFNPFVWFAFHRMRTDRELVCDALVLTRTGGDESYEYGRTMVGLLSRFSRSRPLPALAGILENKSQLKRRIAMIARFQTNSYRWSPAAVATVLAVACLALPGARKSAATANEKPAGLAAAPAPAQGPTFRRLRIPNRIAFDAQLSPDGRSIALGLDYKLWIMPRVGTLGPDYPGALQLVNTGEVKVDPYGLAWSADGRWIAFNGAQLVRSGQREGSHRMYVVSAQGGKPKEVHYAYRGGPAHNRQMSLSPDGEILAFAAADANELHIYTIPVKGGLPKRLVDPPAREPVFSPAGQMIAYVEDKRLGRGGGGLWVVPATGGTPRRVAEAGHACSPVWSPEGRMIAFFDWDEGQHIYIVPINEDGARTGEILTLGYPKEAGGLYRLTGWTPDNQIGAIFRNPSESGLYALSLQGGPATLVTNRGGPLLPHWSADGKRIICSCVVGEKEGRDGWLSFATAWVPAEGGPITRIPVQADTKMLKAGWGAGNNVSPDGKTIVFSGCKAPKGRDGMQIWTLPLEGGRPTQLTNVAAPLADQFPCWSPDGKAVAFVRCRDSGNILKRFTEADILVIPTAGGEPRQLTSESDMVAFGSIAWSPDGKLLAYLALDDAWSREGNTVRVIPAEGGKSRVVARLPGGFEVNKELAWSPDSRRIAFNDGGIRIVSLDDGRVVTIDPGLAGTRLYHLDWSRDGEKLVSAGQQGGEIEFWLIENFLSQQAGK